jgi:hypothetical protein
MNKNKQTKTQEILKNVKLTGQVPSGEVQTLNTEVKVQPPKLKLKIEAEQEYILINKLNEAGIEIKARFIEQDVPTDKAKFLFMLGETCYAAALKYYEPSEQTFETFMAELTETVKKYHKIN